MRRSTIPSLIPSSSAGRFVASLIAAISMIVLLSPAASAQDVNAVAAELESSGYFIEQGAEGTDSRFADLVRQSQSADDRWYFVSMADTVPADFADDLFDVVNPPGNVLVYFLDGDFVNVQLASEASESVENQALAPFDEDWDRPSDFMADVVTEFDRLAGSGSSSAGSSNSGSAGSATSGTSSDSGGGFPWLLVGIPVLLIGGMWFMSRRGKKNAAEENLEAAQKIRAELQTELDELANDVLVLSGPVDVSENDQAIELYREATDTYLEISDELPDVEKLADANLRELSELGTRVAHARWQMDAAEAVIEGEPLPEKPQIAPPPPPKRPPTPRVEQRRQMPRRQPRPRVPYSRSRRSNGGGLLDILIAGAGMMGGRRSGGMFGGGRSRSQPRGGGMFGGGARRSQPRGGGGLFGGGGRSQPRSQPRRGGGVFGGGSGSRSSNRSSGRSSRSSSRSTSRRSSNRRSTSRRRARNVR